MSIPVNSTFECSVCTVHHCGHCGKFVAATICRFLNPQEMSGVDKPKSTRLQYKQFKRRNPEDFEQKDRCIVYFIDELKYSITEKKNIEDFENAKVMAMVTVKEGGKKYAGTLVFIGTEDDCTKRLNDLTKFNAANGNEAGKEKDEGKSLKIRKNVLEKETEAELKKVAKLSEGPAMQSVPDTDSENEEERPITSPETFDCTAGSSLTLIDSWRDKVERKLDQILDKVSAIENLLEKKDGGVILQSTPVLSRKRIKIDDDVGETSGASTCNTPLTSSLMFNGTDLLSLSSGGDSKRYALKVFSMLFTQEEMVDGIVEPSRINPGKTTLDQERVDLLKRAIREKYGETVLTKKWNAMRLSLNQKCIDCKNKKRPKLEEKVEPQ